MPVYDEPVFMAASGKGNLAAMSAETYEKLTGRNCTVFCGKAMTTPRKGAYDLLTT